MYRKVSVGNFTITKAAGGPSGKGFLSRHLLQKLDCVVCRQTSLFQSASVSHAALFTCPASCV